MRPIYCLAESHERNQNVFFRGGPNQTTLLVFKLMRGSYYQYKRAIIGPAAKRHLNGVSLAADDGPTVNGDLIFQGRPLIQHMNFKQDFDNFHPFLKVCHHNYFF